MKQRTLDAEQAKREREAAAIVQEQARVAEAAVLLQSQIRQAEEDLRAGEEKRQREKDEEELANGSFIHRRRAESDATEVPPPGATDTPTETFTHEIEFQGLIFKTVKVFHPRKGELSLVALAAGCCTGLISTHIDGLGTKFSAEPVCEDVNTTIPLDLFVISFDSPYYSSNQGLIKYLLSCPNALYHPVQVARS
jgi:eukaryotic translation initiation factor 2-alpha kinase 4